MIEAGDFVVYTNGTSQQLGVVKGPNNSFDGYFTWYNLGGTASNTQAI